MKEMFHNIKNGELPVPGSKVFIRLDEEATRGYAILKPPLFLCRLGVMDISILSKTLASSTWSFFLSISKIGAICPI